MSLYRTSHDDTLRHNSMLMTHLVLVALADRKLLYRYTEGESATVVKRAALGMTSDSVLERVASEVVISDVS